jgi:hypothetical protein
MKVEKTTKSISGEFSSTLLARLVGNIDVDYKLPHMKSHFIPINIELQISSKKLNRNELLPIS